MRELFVGVPLTRWLALLGLALLVAGYFGFHALFVKVGLSVEQPFSGPAARNDFYVLERYLEERGLAVRSVRRWPEPLTDGALVLWLSPERLPDELRSWLAGGGQVWTFRDPDRAPSEGFAWTITPWPGEELPEPAEDPSQPADAQAEALPSADDAVAQQSAPLEPAPDPTASAPQSDEPAAEEADDDEEDEDEEADESWCADGCLQAAQFRYGTGYLTLVHRFPLENERVSLGETPARIEALLGVSKRPTSVLIVTQLDSPWFGQLLVEHAAEAMLALGVLLALSLWRAGKHFGPKQAAPRRERRQMLEHIDAVGMLAGRVGVGPLLAAARRELRRRLAKRVPHGASLAGAAFVAAVADSTEVSAADVQRALLDEPSGGARQALAIARAMQALWRKT